MDRLYQQAIADVAEEYMKAAVGCIKVQASLRYKWRVRVAICVKKHDLMCS